MDGFGDDVFGEPVSAPAPAQAGQYDGDLIPDINDSLPGAAPGQTLDMSDFGQEQPSAPGGAEASPFVQGADPVVQLSAADTQAAFIGGYTPNPVEEVVAASPATTDPRMAWRKRNQDNLAKKDKEEVAAKKAAAEKAKAYVTKFVQDRTKNLETTKKNNRQHADKASPEAGVPPGATWEKVNALINYQRQDKAHVKDMSRFKSCLQTCKALNVPVTAR